jgi:hypothetical protein
MQFVKLLTAILLLTTSSSGFAPSSRVVAQSAAVPACQYYVYLPMIVNGQGNVQIQQPYVALKTNHSADKPDFNGDGCADLAIGVPQETLDSGGNQGMVQVMYGSSMGVTAEYSQVWHRGGGYDMDGNFLGDIQGDLRANDHFGKNIATGDFNNDGYTDLVIGIHNSMATGAFNAGAAQIIYGSADGLAAANNQFWSQSGGWIDPEGDGSGIFLGDIYGGPEDDDRFGTALAVGNFNGDDYADLAIGVSGEGIGNINGAGAVNVLYGSVDGLTWVDNQFLSQNELRDENNGNGTYTYIGDLVAHAEENDFFGNALAAGDFNGDTIDDLAIGVYGEAIGTLGDAGAIHIVRGSSDGLTAYNNEHWHQQAAYRDTNSDGTVDITIGNPTGLEGSGDWFGYSLAAGNFDGDAYGDLAVGVPNEDFYVDGTYYTNAGVTQVFYGSNEGLSLTNEQWWQQDGEFSIGDMYGSDPEDYDKFGTTLTTGDINGDGYSELVVGAPNESFAEIGGNVGSVNVIYGSSDGLALANHLWFYQDSAIGDDGSQMGDLVGEASSSTYFGQALTIADFDNDGYKELVVGVPGYRMEGTNDEIGAINILKGTGDGLIVPGNQLWHQDGGWDDGGNFLGDLYDTAEDNDAFGDGLP